MSQEIWQAFRDYALIKLPVIPLCPPDHAKINENHVTKCNTPGKRPLITGWTEATPPDVQQISSWEKQNPNANIGLVLGDASGLVAIDIDGVGGEEILKEWSQGELPDTWEFTTPNNGRRLIYKIPEGMTLKKASKADPTKKHTECALMGQGSQTVMPPSVHANGGIYTWKEGHRPAIFGHPTTAPRWIIEAMRGKKEIPSFHGDDLSDTIDETQSPEQILTLLGQKCSRFEAAWEIQQDMGLDEETWFRVISLLCSTGAFDAAKAFSRASTKHGPRSETRLEELKQKGVQGMVRCSSLGCNTKQIQTCFKMHLRYDATGEIINSPGSFIRSHSKFDSSMLINAIETAIATLKAGDKKAHLQTDVVQAFSNLKSIDQVLYSEALVSLRKAGGKIKEIEQAAKQINSKKTLDNTAYLRSIGFTFDTESGNATGINENIYARHLLTRLELVYTTGDRFYEYSEGFWKFTDENAISRILRDILHEYIPNFWKESLEKKYLGALKREATFQQGMDSNRGFINLRNGMLNLSSYVLENHNPKLYSTVQIPIDYDPTATCTRFNAFLDEIFESDEQRIKVVAEMLGYCLTHETKAQKAFILYGQGSNGKSRLIEVMQKLAGAANCSSVPLSDLNSSFARYELVNKIVNIASENEVRDNGFNSEYFKAIATGDQIRVERKFHEGFSYSPLCKLMFAMNSLPFSKDRSHGFHRRLIIIPFEKRFEKGSEDKDLASKLKQELPGILNFALDGLKRLRTNKYTFTESEAIERALNEYKEYTEPNR